MSLDTARAGNHVDTVPAASLGSRRVLKVPLPLAILVGISALFMTTTSVYLIREVRSLRASLLATMEIPLHAIVHPITATDLDQRAAAIDYPDGKKTILFIMSPTCPVCEKNWPQWERIAQGLDPKRARALVLDISNGSIRVLSGLHELHGLPLFTNVSAESVVEYRFRITPQTIVVRAAGRRIEGLSAGRVEGVWTGLLSASGVTQIIATVSR